MKITQIKNGMQPRPYADHVWEWDIITDKPKDEVLAYCQQNLRSARREEADYWEGYRDRSKSFDEHMEIVCGGYYSLTKIDGGYKYKVVQEFID